jgi:putative transposase
LPPTGQAVGIDVGLATFAPLSDGQASENPRFLRREERALARAQRRHQLALDAHKAARASVTERVKQTHPELDEAGVWQAVSQHPAERAAWKHRQKRRRVVARTHERARWKREDFAHQESRRLVTEFEVIALEALSVTSMVQDERFAKSLHDAAWRQFRELIAWKAAWADRRFIAVNPAHTSQDCSGCGNRKTDLTLADRVDRCDCCRLVIDSDLNARRTILAVGRHCLGLSSYKPLCLHMGSRH